MQNMHEMWTLESIFRYVFVIFGIIFIEKC